ncbi:MAG: 2-amino-4-hydroxy-6-hydroxymethyldihydropteridine diphosphokinase [Saprospiraceae bacterium]|nr:2-amino-4-hydroxy-6-hydroxymethyldihydropteridine diphosphokinase [Saprospiraceae bacterium]
MAKAYLLLGGNLGDRELVLSTTKKLITERIGIISVESSIYETEAWGFKTEEKFLNQAIIIETDLLPNEILRKSAAIEKQMGRKKLQHYDSRIIDIDILFYDNWVIKSKKLTIPHPHLHERQFTLKPLNEIIPDFIHPVFEKTIKHLTEINPDKLEALIYKHY